mgnify:CR=1 FL=1
MSEDRTADEKFEDAVINDVIEKVPEEDRHEVKKMMTMSMQMGRVMSASPEMELMKKMTSQNIETFLDGQKSAMEYQFKEARDNKIFIGIVVMVLVKPKKMMSKNMPSRGRIQQKCYQAGRKTCLI